MTGADNDSPRPAIVIHGGAGTLTRTMLTPERALAYHESLRAALHAGARVLVDGGSALDAVTAAVVALEDDPLFNAGRGAVFTADGRHELDAAIMDGASGRAGAVAGVTRVRHPVLAARTVMTRTDHVMIIGDAADRLARAHGLECVDPSWFSTQARREQLDAARRADSGATLDHDGQASGDHRGDRRDNHRFGTVGAVALDAAGHLAAATSTGGMTNKLPGRVGDSPLIGAGCYADDATLAASATGHGERFIETVACHRAAAAIEFKGLSLAEATAEVIFRRLPLDRGRGGMIAIDRAGRIAMPFNTEGMYRGWQRVDGTAWTAIFDDDLCGEL
ncbi:MAG: isoaspartyl peptidase/L-asparaginase [Burkholderiaceae bacterium]